MKTHDNRTARQEALAERSLFVAISLLRSPDEVRAFFQDLCTPTELQAMADRWAVAEHLKREVPYREISRLTGVSSATIVRVARFLASGYGGYETAARRVEERRQGISAGARA
jgi:TrpR-related protein YerC/YecD